MVFRILFWRTLGLWRRGSGVVLEGGIAFATGLVTAKIQISIWILDVRTARTAKTPVNVVGEIILGVNLNARGRVYGIQGILRKGGIQGS